MKLVPTAAVRSPRFQFPDMTLMVCAVMAPESMLRSVWVGGAVPNSCWSTLLRYHADVASGQIMPSMESMSTSRDRPAEADELLGCPRPKTELPGRYWSSDSGKGMVKSQWRLAVCIGYFWSW